MLSKLSTDKRNNLDDDIFGIPDKRKYPLTDKEHVLKAVQFFKFADKSDRDELAKRIIKRAKELNMDYSNWDSLKSYLSSNFNESYTDDSSVNLKMDYERVDEDFYGMEAYDYKFYNVLPDNVFDWVGHCYIINNTYPKYSFESYYITPGIWIHDFVIDEKYRGKYIGTWVMKYMIKIHNIDHIACEKDNTVALHIYDKCGFKEYEQRGDMLFLKRTTDVDKHITDSANRKITDINILTDFIAKCGYGVPDPITHKLITGNRLTEKFYNENYKHMSVDEFKKYRCGTCWDYVTYEAEYLKEHNIDFNMFFIVVKFDENDFDTHTYIVAKIDDNTSVYIEGSVKSYTGNIYFKPQYDIHKLIAHRMLTYRHASHDSALFDVYDYTNNDPPIGCGCTEYMDHIFEFGKLLYENKIVKDDDEFHLSEKREISTVVEYYINEKEGNNMLDTETLTDIEDEVFQEASQSKKSTERRNMQKTLKEIDYDKDTKTIKTTDADGKERRVNFSIDGKTREDLEFFSAPRKDSFVVSHSSDDENSVINITKKTLKGNSKNNGLPIIGHELSHEKDHYNAINNISSSNIDKFILCEAEEFIKKHGNKLNSHDSNSNELVADVRGAEKMGFSNMINNHSMFIKTCGNIFNETREGLKYYKEIYDRLTKNGYNLEYDKIEDLRNKMNNTRKKLEVLKNEIKNGNSDSNDKLAHQIDILTKRLNNKKDEISELYKNKHDVNTHGSVAKTISDTKKNIDQITEYLKTCQKSLEDSTNLRIQFLREMKQKLKQFKADQATNPDYKHPKKIIKEQLVELFDDNDYLFEECLIDNVVDTICQEEDIIDIEDDNEVVQEGMFEAGFNTLRCKLAEALKDKFKISHLTKGMGSNADKFIVTPIEDETKKVNVISTGSGVKVPGYVSNVALSRAFDKLMEIFTSPDFITEYSVQLGNDEDEDDVSVLNKLVASELSAMEEYFDAAKNTDDETLGRLYADIGSEERFHSEQLMYAKSLITGEKYEPRDPEVKEEYQKLIDQGMDEESALTTVTDRFNISNNADVRDLSDLEEDFTMLEYALNQCDSNLDILMMVCEHDTSDFTTEINKCFDIFAESFVMEGVNNVNGTENGMRSDSPASLIMKGFKALGKFIAGLIKAIKSFCSRMKIVKREQSEWLKTHSIKELFGPGISMYFYSDKHHGFISSESMRYSELMYDVTLELGKHIGINDPKFQHMNPKQNRSYERIKFNTISHGLEIIKGVVLTKSKIVVNSENEESLKQIFFGYSPNKVGDKSMNVYNILDSYCTALDAFNKVANEFVKRAAALEKDPHSLFYTNRAEYDKTMNGFKIVIKGFSKFSNALAHDMNVLMKLNNDIIGMTDKKDNMDKNTYPGYAASVSDEVLKNSTNNNDSMDW